VFYHPLHTPDPLPSPPHTNPDALPNLFQNAAAKSIICKICRQDFQVTTKMPALEQHASTKHAGKTVGECFDGVAA
jgi:hypothetical protein